MDSTPSENEPDPALDEDYPLSSPDSSSRKAELPAEVDVDKDLGDPWSEAELDEKRVQFSLRELLAFMLLTAGFFSVAASLPGDRLENFAGLAGLAVLIGMVILEFLKQRRLVLRLWWWGMLILYLLATGAAVVVTIVRRLH